MIGPELHRLRARKALSLKELAAEIGTSVSALHRYESGWDRFEVRTLRRLARALDARLEISLEARDALHASGRETPTLLADRLRPLFWDVDLTADHLKNHPQWVLRRVLQYGDWEDVHRARKHFGDDAVREAADHRSVDARTRRLWQLVLGPGTSSR